MAQDSPQRRILVIGDSLTVACQNDLSAAEARHGLKFVVRAENGRSAMSARAIVSSTTDVSDVVIALGTNDYNLALSTLDQLIDETVDAVPPTSRLWWVDLGLTDGRDVRFNASLVRAAERHEQLRLIVWSDLVHSDSRLLGDDGVHLTPEGRRARAELIARVVGGEGLVS